MTQLRLSILIVLLATMALTAGDCRRESEDPFLRTTGGELVISGFWPLLRGQGFYEVWLGVPSETPPDGVEPWDVPQDYFPLASFRVDSLAAIVNLAGDPQREFPLPRELDAGRIARAIVTYQLSSQVGAPHPPGMVLAGGPFIAPGGTISTTLSWNDDAVIEKDLTELSGSYLLSTPTIPGGEELAQGVWFFALQDELRVPSLNLGSDLPADLVYEAWLYRTEFPSIAPREIYSLGRFRVADALDSDEGGPNAGLADPPEFPGQDFFLAAPEGFGTGNWIVMITIEPTSDPAPQIPSTLRVLRDDIPLGTEAQFSLQLSNGALNGSLPEVVLTVRR